MRSTDRWISIISGVITIGNFTLALSGVIEIPEVTGLSVQIPFLVIRILIFLLLEIIITYFFALALTEIGKTLDGKNAHVILLVGFLWLMIAVLSIYTSVFNIKWLFLDYLDGTAYWVALIFWSIISNTIYSVHVVGVVQKKDDYNYEEVERPVIIAHWIVFVVLCFLLHFDGFFGVPGG